MIVLDTTVLVFAKGQDHPLREPCRRLVEAIESRRTRATTTPEVIQEFVHIAARRRSRAEAIELGSAYADLLAPLTVVDDSILRDGLRRFGETARLGAFDAVLAAVAVAIGADALVSANAAFAELGALDVVVPGTTAFDALVAG